MRQIIVQQWSQELGRFTVVHTCFDLQAADFLVRQYSKGKTDLTQAVDATSRRVLICSSKTGEERTQQYSESAAWLAEQSKGQK